MANEQALIELAEGASDSQDAPFLRALLQRLGVNQPAPTPARLFDLFSTERPHPLRQGYQVVFEEIRRQGCQAGVCTGLLTEGTPAALAVGVEGAVEELLELRLELLKGAGQRTLLTVEQLLGLRVEFPPPIRARVAPRVAPAPFP